MVDKSVKGRVFEVWKEDLSYSKRITFLGTWTLPPPHTILYVTTERFSTFLPDNCFIAFEVIQIHYSSCFSLLKTHFFNSRWKAL